MVIFNVLILTFSWKSDPSITPAIMCAIEMISCPMRAAITSHLLFRSLQVYRMLMNVLKILLNPLLYSL